MNDDERAEFGDRLADAAAVMDGEADELAARRPHPDAHLYDVEEGLRLHAAELDEWLQAAYYRAAGAEEPEGWKRHHAYCPDCSGSTHTNGELVHCDRCDWWAEIEEVA